MKRSNMQWWGIVLIVVGMLLLLGNMSGMDLGKIVSTWWPLLLVAWGLSMLLRQGGSDGRDTTSIRSVAGMATISSDQLAQSTVFGDVAVRIASPSFRGGTLSTVFGDSEVDMRECALADGEFWLKLSGVFGDTTVVLPKDVSVSVAATTTFGDVDLIGQRQEGFTASLNYESPGFQTAAKKLHIQASQVFGDILIRR